MNLRTIAAGLVFALIFFLALVAAIVAATELSGGTEGPDADIRVGGIGHGGFTVNYSPARGSARRYANSPGVPRIPDEMVERLVKRVMEKAEQGDTDCAMFVLELAAAQRSAKPAPATQPVAR